MLRQNGNRLIEEEGFIKDGICYREENFWLTNDLERFLFKTKFDNWERKQYIEFFWSVIFQKLGCPTVSYDLAKYEDFYGVI